MIPVHYSEKRAEKLCNFPIGPITEPYSIVTHWINVFTPQISGNYISDKMHRHAFFELHLILNGSAVYGFSGANDEALRPGQAIIISPGTRHIVKKQCEDIFKFSVTFSVDTESRLFKELTAFNYKIFPIGDSLFAAIDTIFEETEKNTVFSDTIIKGRLLEIYSCLPGASHIPSVTRKKHTTDIRFENAVRYITDNLSSPLTCAEIANHCGISTKQLSRLFSKHTGKGPLEYIHAEKARTAQKLLAESDLSIRIISEQLGFSNEYYFNTFFTRHFGIPPGYFRKNKS